jgi:hypothetical protein
MRGLLSSLSSQWRSLTQSQRDAFASYALAHPRNNSLGATIVLTGLQTFIGINSVLSMLGSTVATVPPASDLATMPVGEITDDSHSSVEWTYEPDPVPGGTFLLLFGSPPVSAGVSYNGDYRFLIALPAASTGPEDITALLTAKWGVIQIDQKFFFRSYLFTTSGARGPDSAVFTAILS